MSKFASKSPSKKYNPEITETVNHEGGQSFTLPAKERLATRVLTSLVNENQFYGDQTGNLLDDLKEVAKTDPEFVLKLAAYTRNVMYMRSSPVFTFAHASLIPECKPLIRKYAPGIVKRADEPAEVLGVLNTFFKEIGQKPVIPNSVKKGLGDALTNFDAYQLMKYKGEGNPVNLWDVFNICHPKPKDTEQATVWNKFMNGKLETAKTWESHISKEGSKKESWEEIIPSMGYMALLRNLRNFIKNGISEDAAEMVAAKLKDPKEVARSKQIPFRFYSAYRELSKMVADDFMANHYWRHPEPTEKVDHDKRWMVDLFRNAVSDALDISCEKVTKLPGTTAIFSDHSGSMSDKVSAKSSITRMEVALVLHAIAARVNPKNVGMVFGQSAAFVDNHGLSTMRFIKAMADMDVGHSTNGYICFEQLIARAIEVDRIIVLSDMQLYNDGSSWGSNPVNSHWEQYRKKVPGAHLHMVDLAGYGSSFSPINGQNVNLYAGWTSEFLNLIKYAEEGVKGMISNIERFELR